MANVRYQYGTSPRKIQPDEIQNQRKRKQKIEKKPKLKVVKEVTRQEVKVSKEQRKRQLKLTMFAVMAFAVLLAISYQNSQISIKFAEMQSQKKELASLQKENEQLEINIENSLNLSNIEKEAKEQLAMEKLTNKQTVYVNLQKKDYVEAATEKVVIDEEKSWFEKVADWIFQRWRRKINIEGQTKETINVNLTTFMAIIFNKVDKLQDN